MMSGTFFKNRQKSKEENNPKEKKQQQHKKGKKRKESKKQEKRYEQNELVHNRMISSITLLSDLVGSKIHRFWFMKILE